MRKNCLAILCVSSVIIILTSSAQAQNTESKEPQKITCTGKVVDEQGKPMADVKVSMHEMVYDEATYTFDSNQIGQVQTEPDGGFSFSEIVKDNRYRYGYIVAEKEGLAAGFDNWSLRDGDKELQIKLGQPKEIAGIVTDEQGNPVADARVTVSMLVLGEGRERKNLNSLAAPELLTTNTNSAGNFSFTHIPAGATAEFIVEKSGKATVSTYKHTGEPYQKLNFTEGQKDIKLVLPVEAKIEGLVVEKNTGKPVGGVKARYESGQEAGYYRPKPLISKEDGTFSIDALIATRYVVELVQPRDRLPDWVAEPVEAITEAGTTKSNVKLELCKGGVLEIVVRDAKNKQPVKKASVNLHHETSGRYVSSSSGADGVARMRLMPGDYQVMYLYKQGYTQQRLQGTVTIEDGKTEHLEYDLVSLPKITGIVRDEKGTPIKEAKLRICPGGRDDAVSDEEGKFEAACDLGGWPSGQTPVMFLVGRYEKENLAAAIQIEEDARAVDITLKPGVIFSGKVIDPNDKGIEGANVTVMLRGPSWGSSIGRDQITSDAQGRFEIKAIPAEHKYSLYVVAEGYGEIRKEGITTDDAVNNHLDLGALILPVANLSVSGVVVDNDGKPVAGARIYCSGEGQPRSRAETDIEGKFTLAKVCAGRIRINADKSGTTRLYGSIETEGGATDIRIAISQRSTSTGYEPRRPPSLVGRPLPELKDAGINLPPADTDGKIMLVCLFDMEQRPSRHCVTQLAKQAEQLKSKGVTVVAIQASKMDQTTLNQWVEKYNIPFPVGMVQGDAEKARFTWGVRSLPWLILTDSRHIVRSAGFRINELNEKIGEMENVER